jgi:alpha-galactosidase
MNHRFTSAVCIIGVGLLLSTSVADGAEQLPLSELDLQHMTAGWGQPRPNLNCTGQPLKLGGKTYSSGVGTHANSSLHVKLDGQAVAFHAVVGVDDQTQGRGSVRFRIYGDSEILFDSGVMKGGDSGKAVDVSLAGIQRLVFLATAVDSEIDFDHANWADAVFTFSAEKPTAVGPPSEQRIMLTPKPGPEPRINGPRLFGARPGRPFLYRIPCSGQRPIEFDVSNLPRGLHVDTVSGIISGTAPGEQGQYPVTLHAKNDHGAATKEFTVVVGDKLALTPPMGWNSWYTWYHTITDNKMRVAADQMIATGMADVGYMYVNIDDCWMMQSPQGHEVRKDRLLGQDVKAVVGKTRGPNGEYLSNAHFPDMRAMTDYIHAKGLRAGIYTSPGARTCQQYESSYGRERQDAQQFAAWGFDFLKYDWCSYGEIYRQRIKQSNDELLEHQRPFQQMGDILATLDRDIVFNLCQYGMKEVWKWGASIGGHCWRTTGDLGLARGDHLPGFYQIGFANMQHFPHAGPGAWNDPDYILIGYVGVPPSAGFQEPQPTELTPNEQYSYMSMWSLMAAPLFFSGDMARLDDRREPGCLRQTGQAPAIQRR